jgi:enediyne biosynthesis protein E4
LANLLNFLIQSSVASPFRGVFRQVGRRSFFSFAGVLLLSFGAFHHMALRNPEAPQSAAIQFVPKSIDFRLETDETPIRHVPATMAGGVAVFDFNRDGRPDIFFTNGANIETLQKDSPKYKNRLFRNDGDGVFTDVTDQAGLAGTGYDNGVAVADYDNDGYPDIFVAGVHHNTLYHNNGNGTFTDVTTKAGLDRADSKFGPLWSVSAVWVDVNGDGLLDLFLVNYLQWDFASEHICGSKEQSDYCAPSFYEGLPNQLFINQGDGTFRDVSDVWGVRQHVGKGMGVGMADYDGDGRPDLFVTNDGYYNFMFHNLGNRFEENALPLGVALTEDGNFVSGMGLDFRDSDNDGYPDIFFVALDHQTFPLFKNIGGKEFREITSADGLRSVTINNSGFGAGVFDFDNDGWKDAFVTGGHVLSAMTLGARVNQQNMVFRNGGSTGKWLAERSGLDAVPAARNRGCAFGDFDLDGRMDVVTTAIGRDAVIWMNRTQSSGHWLNLSLQGTRSNRDGIGARLKVVSKSGTQYNHMTTTVGYASSSDGPVHFGMGKDTKADRIDITWPSGIVQTLRGIPVDQVLTIKEPQN